MIEVICCPPIEITTSAISPLIRTGIDSPDQLIAAADAPHNFLALAFGFASRPEQKPVHLALRNPMVSTHG